MYIRSDSSTIKNSSNDSDDLDKHGGLPLPALIAIPIMSVMALIPISIIIYRCVRYRKLQSAFKEQSSIPKIDLSHPPGFVIDEQQHTITPYPPSPTIPLYTASRAQYPMINFDQSNSPLLSLQPSLQTGASNHSRTALQEGLSRNEGVQDVPPSSYVRSP